MISCPGCRGKKKLIGLGNIMKNCPLCNGIGWIEDKLPAPMQTISKKEFEEEYPNVSRTIDEQMDIPKVKKKPGRKPKVETVLHV